MHPAKRTHSEAEVRNAHNQYMADHVRFMKNGRIELWYMDNGSEFGAPKFWTEAISHGLSSTHVEEAPSKRQPGP